MADFNNKNTNKKSYNNNNNRPQNKKPYFGDNNKKNFGDNRKFDKDFDDKKSFDTPRKPRTPKAPVARKPVFRPRGVEAPEFAGEVIEYKMSAALADTILKSDKTKRTPQEVLCEYVNTQCGLKGFCVRVSYF